VLSMCTVGYLSYSARLSRIILVVIVTMLDCHLFSKVLFFLHAPRHIWITPYFYGTVHSSFIVLEISDKPRRFCHRSISRLFSYHVREMHIQTMLWVRPLVSLYFAAILSCMLLTLENHRDFEAILIRLMNYYLLWCAIANSFFHLTAHSDSNMLSVIFPDQRTTAEIHNLNKTIGACIPSDEPLDVLVVVQAREDFLWQRSANSPHLLPVQQLPMRQSLDDSISEQRADENT